MLDRIANGADLLSSIVRNLEVELFLEGHHQLNGVQAVSAQIIDEARRFNNFVFLDDRRSTTIFFTRSATSLMAYFPKVVR